MTTLHPTDDDILKELAHPSHPIWHVVLDQMPQGVLIVDHEMRVLMQNSSTRQLFPSPLSSRPLRLIDLVRDPNLYEGFRHTLDHGATTALRLELRRGEPRTFQVTIAPLPPESPQAAVGLFVEITALEHLERVRRDFLANLSHELRTPLAAILAQVESLQEIAADIPPPVRRSLEGLFRHAQRLHALVRDILELAEIESGHLSLSFEELPLSTLVEDVLALVGPRAEEMQITISTEIPADLRVVADADRLTQILYNLLDNAVKFNRPRGGIWISARQEEDRVFISVRDTGIGIPLADQERIFERFYRGEKSRSRETGGSGLGLAIVKHLVRLHGGEITVRSEPGIGSEFTFSVRSAR